MNIPPGVRSLSVAISKLDFMGQILLKVVSAGWFYSLVFFCRCNRLWFSKNVCWKRWNGIDWLVSCQWDKNSYQQSWWKRVPLFMRFADVILIAQKHYWMTDGHFCSPSSEGNGTLKEWLVWGGFLLSYVEFSLSIHWLLISVSVLLPVKIPSCKNRLKVKTTN